MVPQNNNKQTKFKKLDTDVMWKWIKKMFLKIRCEVETLAKIEYLSEIMKIVTFHSFHA